MPPYNPLEKRNLAESLQRHILAAAINPLSDAAARRATSGAGVYALYYNGPFADYAPMSEANSKGKWALPIYVGKAIPAGARVGSGIDSALEATRSLGDRLSRHSRSIDETSNLDLADFSFRYLVIDDVWIPLGEAILIENFQPLWNTVLSGFGSNPTGGPRAAQALSKWDTLHPGRSGAGVSPGSNVQAVRALVAAYFASMTP